jgi:hypothetical protein
MALEDNGVVVDVFNDSTLAKSMDATNRYCKSSLTDARPTFNILAIAL